MRSKALLTCVCLLLLAGCDNETANRNSETAGDKAQAATTSSGKLVQATTLRFEEQEEGVEPYPLRMIVTKQFLRMDDGPDAKSYLLLDRAKKTIYNVNAEDRTILEIPGRKIILPEEGRPDLEVTEQDSRDMPSFGARQPVYKTLSVGNKACYNVIAIPELMPDTVAAMREYLQTLSSQQIENLDKTPKAMRDPCMMANLVFYPTKHLEFGFPLREWDYRGFVREMVDFGKSEVNSSLFSLPPDYRRMTLDRKGLHPLNES